MLTTIKPAGLGGRATLDLPSIKDLSLGLVGGEPFHFCCGHLKPCPLAGTYLFTQPIAYSITLLGTCAPEIW